MPRVSAPVGSEQVEGLRVALEAANGLRDLVQGALTVVPKRRMPKVVTEAGGLDDVRVATEILAERAAYLGHLKRMREAGTNEIVNLRAEHLRLGAQFAQRAAECSTRPRSRSNSVRLGLFRGFRNPALGIF